MRSYDLLAVAALTMFVGGCSGRPCGGATEEEDYFSISTQEDADRLWDVASARTVTIRGDEVEDISGLQCLSSLGELKINGTTRLSSVPDMPDVERMPALDIVDNTALVKIGRFGSSDTEMDDATPYSFRINENPVLKEIGRAPSMSGVQDFMQVEDNLELTSLAAFDNLEYVRSLTIRGNTSLRLVTELSSLTIVEERVTITGNTSLEPCDDLLFVSRLISTPNVSVQTPPEDCPAP